LDQWERLGEETLRSLIATAVAILLALVLHAILFRILRRIAARTRTIVDDSIATHSRGPARLLFVMLFLQMALPLVVLPETAMAVVGRTVAILLIVSVAWLLVSFVHVGRDVVAARFDITVADNLQARRIHTQYDILAKIVTTVIVVLALACVLMTFDEVRQLGAGILASAGIVGILVGFAAQRSLGTLFAGIQIALTQPIRLDDVVIVEGEWGRVEEITLTYVVVRIWDERRLVLPITYFIEKPFQNWTRVSAQLLGTVYLHVDATVPVEEIRAEVERLCKEDERWDGRVAGLVVTDVGERSIQLRALVSAADSGRAWDLRCHVREQLVAFVRDRYPEALPHLRILEDTSPAG